MKYAEFIVEFNKIEFLNSFFGVESVLLNGKIISKKFSFSGIKHKVKLKSSDLTLESNYKQFDKKEIILELKNNEELLDKRIVETDKKQRFYWMLIGMVLGFCIYKILDFLLENYTV
ncbi:hypothetical protein [Polaribacter sp. HaHaR_3_91]|uniref:hypothetical protein n=1 Tax=Polaribacter sp. HaHaR_3_91 TaxID=2745561 RepID=UPI001C4FBD73|nr:hypothetical protein [Polaribacter sp. HaHaR_3_91]QXP64030.1 hypothetical protein H0I27_02235 [Polaribacter sp. HaHaR_3_91]